MEQRSLHTRNLFCILFLAGVAMVVVREAQAQFRNVTLGVNMSHYHGPCPAHLRFTGNITVENYPMTYNYKWERSDGAHSGSHVVKVNDARDRHIVVTEDWTLSPPGRTEVWMRLRVRSGNTNVESNSANVVIECR